MKQPHQPPHQALRTATLPTDRRVEARVGVSILVLLASTALLCRTLPAADNGGRQAQKEFDNKLKQARSEAELRNAVDGARSPEERQKAQKAMNAARDAEEKKRSLAEYKEKTMQNLGSVKEMFAKAEEAWKEKNFGKAGPLYSSVAGATVPGSEEMSDTSRNRMLEMEDLARVKLKAADDADLKRDYTKEVDELSYILRELNMTSGREVALRRLASLKSRPDVAGIVDVAEAEGLEAEGRLLDAVAAYSAIANNPRYDNTIASLKARRRIEALGANEETRAKLKGELDTKAEKEAPILLGSAKNFIANNMPKQAVEKLQAVIDKFPDSKYAEEAKQKLAELK